MINPQLKIKYNQAKELLQDGDVLLFKGQGLFSFFIKRAGEGKYSHAALVSTFKNSSGEKTLECVEFREWKGGRTISLEQCVKDNSGIIDVYRPSSCKTIVACNGKGQCKEVTIKLDTDKVVDTMRRSTGLPYGWKRIWWIIQHKMPILRFFYSIDSIIKDDYKKELVYPVCSTAVAHSFSSADYDLIHNRSDEATEPSDISKSPLLHYVFTLI